MYDMETVRRYLAKSSLMIERIEEMIEAIGMRSDVSTKNNNRLYKCVMKLVSVRSMLEVSKTLMDIYIGKTNN